MTPHLGSRSHVRALEEVIQEIIAAGADRPLPEPIVGAIAHAQAVRDVERCRRGMPRYGEAGPMPTPNLIGALRRRGCHDE